MIHTNDKVIKHKVGLLNLIEALGNVPKACKLQIDLDQWLIKYNTRPTHQGKMCCGRTPMETLINGKAT